MKRRNFLGAILLFIFAIALLSSSATATDTLAPEDFKQESWSKTIDFFDYVRAYASTHGKTPPPTNWHAYLNLVYINTTGLQLLYAGLANITTGQSALTIPIQTFIEHYKTQNGKDVIMASSFIMLLAYNETLNSLYSNSPDRNDNLYASFSLGRDLSQYIQNGTPPALNSKTTIIPLTSSPDKLNWYWGMKYTNLTAIWWKAYIDPVNPRYDDLPIAVTVYDELTFTYNLTINPSQKKATVTANYIIGKMTNLWLIKWFFLIPFTLHYNSTGCYRPNGMKYSDETIYKFIKNQGISMSIVLFQNSVILDHTTYSEAGGQNVTDQDVFVTDSAISTYADDEEKVFETTFNTKKTYRLYNYTADQTETEYTSYETYARTCKVRGFAENPIFTVHTSLLRLIPAVIAHMHPPLYEKAKDRISNMTYADYFYIISYPTYSGYRIEHDPTFTAYITTSTTPPQNIPKISPFLIIGIVGTAAIIVVAVVILRRKTKTLESPTPLP